MLDNYSHLEFFSLFVTEAADKKSSTFLVPVEPLVLRPGTQLDHSMYPFDKPKRSSADKRSSLFVRSIKSF